ncbi:hypothetical protein ACI3P4_13010, partial [Glaesserella parasuis]
MEFSGASFGLISKVIQFIWIDIEKEIRNLQFYINELDENEIDEYIILSARENNNAVDFTNKTKYLNFFKQLESALSKIDNKFFLPKKYKEDNVKKIIIAIPNRLLWLISIYCLSDKELKILWSRYFKLVSLLPLHNYSSVEMGVMNEKEFADVYSDDKPEPKKFYYSDQLEALKFKLEQELAINIANGNGSKMKKTTKILTALTLFAAVCGGGYYYTQLYPEHKDINRLETLIHQIDFYGDKLAKAELDIFPIDRLKQLAEKIIRLLNIYWVGIIGKKKIKRKQKKWFSRAANQNFAPAYRALAYTYDADSYERKTFLAKAVS